MPPAQRESLRGADRVTGGRGDLAAWTVWGLVGGVFYGLITGAVLARVSADTPRAATAD